VRADGQAARDWRQSVAKLPVEVRHAPCPGSGAASVRDVSETPAASTQEDHMADRNRDKDFDRDLEERGAKNQVEGSLKEMEGKVRNTAGDLVDDESEQVKGKAKEIEGKIQKNIGKPQNRD
jgi:uncharacterized protein YjbJ (UPF0337 family)